MMTSTRDRLHTFLLSSTVVVVISAMCACLALFKPVLRIFHTVFIDYNEGSMAFLGTAAWGGGVLYRPMEDYVLNGYPPASFYVLGFVGSLTHDTIVAGRLLSLGGLLVTAAASGYVIQRLSGWRIGGLCGAVTLLAYMGFHHEDYVAMNDPQWMAHGVMMIGLVILLRGQNRASYSIAAFIMVLAGLIKHNLLGVPVGVAVWLYGTDRRQFWFWIICMGCTVVAALLALLAAYGPVVFQSILLAPREFRLGSIAKAGVWLLPAVIYVAGSLWFMVHKRTGGERRLIGAILVVSLLAGLGFSGGAGVYTNAIYEFVIFSIIASFGLLPPGGSGEVQATEGMHRTLLLWALVLPVALPAPFRFYESKEYVKHLPTLEQQSLDDISFVSTFAEPVLCTNPAMAFWAGKEFDFDLFTSSQKFRMGALDASGLVESLDQRRFSLLQLDDAATKVLPIPVMDGIRRNYTVVRRTATGGVFLVPSK